MTVQTSRAQRWDMRRSIPASAASAESISLEVRAALPKFCDEANAFAAELLLREALTNALVHGSACNPAKFISLALRLDAGHVFLAVSDGGAGFDWRRLMSHAAGECDVCGRGIEIFKLFANRVRFSREGSSVVLFRRFSEAQ